MSKYQMSNLTTQFYVFIQILEGEKFGKLGITTFSIQYHKTSKRTNLLKIQFLKFRNTFYLIK